jgi:hypothetical protein
MKRYTLSAILVTLAGTLLLVGGEMLVRAFPTLLPVQRQIRTQAVLMKDRVLPDLDVGFVRSPNSREEVRTLDFAFIREADALGFPNRGPWPGRAQVVVLGDSLATGEGVGLEGSFVGRFSGAFPELSVRNLSVAGGGPDRQYRIYQKYGASLEPEIILAVLNVAADFTNVEHFQSWLKAGVGQDYNRFRLNFGRNFTRLSLLDPRTILAKSRLVEAVGGQLANWVEADADDVVITPDGSPIYITPGNVEFLRTEMPPNDPRLDLVIESYANLNRQARLEGAEFFVLLIPSKEEVYRDAKAVISAVRERLASGAVPFLDLYPVLRAEARGTPLYFTRDPHLNERGNAVVAAYLVNWWRGRKGDLMHTRIGEGQNAVSFSTQGQEALQ